jgi:hypothetical protein
VTRPILARLSRGVAAVGVGALVAGLLATTPAAASGPQTTVTVLLKAPDPARLAQLATATGDNHAQRVRDLAGVLPTAAAHQVVRGALRSAGFTIGHQTAWTIDATAPESVVDATFGDLARLAGRARVRGVLPTIPASIASVAAAVLPETDTPPLFKEHLNFDGPDFRNAYTPPLTSPKEGSDKNGQLTIASIQFAGWNDSDLSFYAAQPSVNIKPDPIASGQYKQFADQGSKIPGATAMLDEEVDLDQEVLLSTAPHARQRAYFDTNSSNGYVQALSQVLADVTQGQGKSSDGGDPKIVALTTSWGACEDGFQGEFPGDIFKAVEALLQSLNAAGVTTFAASGDDGVYDCATSNLRSQLNRISVDYPASSPSVVAVGGTKLTAVGGIAANDGTNWAEKGWTCTGTTASPTSCTSAKGSGGSGGGESNTFAMPAYQKSGIGHQPFRTETGKKGDFGAEQNRLVPDIAVAGDPHSGFQILTSDPKYACPTKKLFCDPKTNPGPHVVGGTSLSAPLAAALFTNMLASAGATSGVGDIHGALYSAYAAKTGVFRDPTTGRNGDQADVDRHAAAHAAAELPTRARVGFDTVTGLGAPLWTLLTPYVLSPKAPAASASIELAKPHARHHTGRVRVSWRPAAKARSLVAASARVVVTRLGDPKPIYRRNAAPPSGTYHFSGVHGANYVVTVTVTDVAGRKSPTDSALLAVPYDDGAFHTHGPWHNVKAASDLGGSHLQTAKAGATASVRASGRRYLLIARTGPAYGKLAVLVGGHHVKTVNLYSPAAGHKVIDLWGSKNTARKARTLTFRCTGNKGTFSTGFSVDVDGLDALH